MSTGHYKSPEGYDVLTDDERRIVRALERLAKNWPRDLVLFAGDGMTLSMRRDPRDGGFIGAEYEIARIPGIRNEGGDGGDYRG